MSRNKAGNEEILHRYIEEGVLVIDSEGKVWRKARLKWNVRTKSNDVVPCLIKRADVLHKSGYFYVRIGINKKSVWAQSHRIVWLHFNGPIPKGLSINHINGIATDNHPLNLELATPKEQVWHARHVLKKPCGFSCGEKHYAATVSDAQIESMRQLKREGWKQKDIAIEYGTSPQFVSSIIRGTRRSKNLPNLPLPTMPDASEGDTSPAPSPPHAGDAP